MLMVGRLPRSYPRWGDAPFPFAPIANRHVHSTFSGGTLTADESVPFAAGTVYARDSERAGASYPTLDT